ncbi:MAG: HEAT repeat domain-containing protein [Alphaproteobacteria bacterium]|nr:HEAT repeat domain-containing protein [Alphaproteobacteria bacterium]
MKPHYTKTGLDAYLAAVPLPLPLPPGDPSSWTCLYTLIGPGVALHRESYIEAAPKALLRDLLELAGRPCGADEARELLLVTPIPGDTDLVRLLTRAMRDRQEGEAARLLGLLGDPAAVPALLDRMADAHPSLREECARALGRLGAGRDVLAQWDGDIDAARLLALVEQGVVPDELPAGELEPLASWLPGLDAAAGRTVLEAIDELGEPLSLVVPTVLARHPAVAAELAEPLAEHLARACDHAVWAEAIAAAGEEIVDLVLEGMASEDWRTRMGAAIALGTLEESGERGMDALRKALTDDDSDVRREASLALGLRGGPMKIEIWSDAYGFLDRAKGHPWGAALRGGPVPLDLFAMLSRRDSSEILARTCLALAFAHPEMAAPALEALARDPGFDVPLDARQAAAAGLLAAGVPPDGAPGLHRLLLRGIGATPSGAIDGLTPEDLAGLAARDGDWQVRYAALAFLDRTGHAARYDGLLAMLAEVDTDSDVRERASSMRTPKYRPQGVARSVARLVVSSRIDDDQRARALEEVASLDASLGEALAVALLEHTNRAVAVLAGRIAGRSAKGADVEPRLKAALGQLRAYDWIRREAAAALLGSLDPNVLDEALFEELVEQLEAAGSEDDDSDVQRMATWAAGELKRRRQ